MDAGVIIAIVVGALILIALLVLVARRGRDQRLESKRGEAREIRREAEVGRAQADRTRAEAEERAARARQEEATAREQAASAEARQQEARERHLEAARLDPDADEREAAERFDREQSERGSAGGITSHGHEAGATTEGDADRVEHYERTQTPGEERERHVVQDEQGNVVRDEEHREPRP